MINKKKFIIAFIIWNVAFFSFDAWLDTRIDQEAFEEYLEYQFPPVENPSKIMGGMFVWTAVFAINVGPPLMFSIEKNIQKNGGKQDVE